MAITALSRICQFCRAMNSDPDAMACPGCGVGIAPHHERWPLLLKWWMLSDGVVDMVYPWEQAQTVWQDRLHAILRGRAITKPTPWKIPVSQSTPIVDVYQLALERAQWWRQAGSPLGVRVIAPPLPRTPHE